MHRAFFRVGLTEPATLCAGNGVVQGHGVVGVEGRQAEAVGGECEALDGRARLRRKLPEEGSRRHIPQAELPC